MNIKKYFDVYIVLALMGFGLSACSDEYESRLRELILKDMEFPSGGDTKEQVFRHEDLSNYAIASDADWCKPEVDAANNKIIITVAGNDTYGARTSIVTMSDIKVSISRIFNVNQLQNNGLQIDTTSYDVVMEGGMVNIKVKSNVSYEVAIPETDDWITKAASTRALEESTVTLNIAKNNSGAAREGRVTISSSEAGLSTTVKVSQQFQPIFSVDMTSIECDESGGDFQIPVHANITIDSYIDGQGWASIKTRTWKDDENFIENIHVDPFKEKKKERTCSVVLENAYWSKSQTVIITQYRPLYIEGNSRIELEAPASYKLSLYNKDDVEVSWMSTNEGVATVNAFGLVEGVGEGECTITVTSADGKHTDSVKVAVTVPTDPTPEE